MTIQDEMVTELRDAMKTGDTARRDVIRQIQTEVATARSAPGFAGAVDDALYVRVITSYTKKMEKARSEYLDIGGRGAAMAEKLAYEIEYLGRWLPKKLGQDETRELVRQVISTLGVAGDPKAAGRVTGTLMRERGEDLDGALVSRLVTEELAAD